jgi:hypothetical protein
MKGPEALNLADLIRAVVHAYYRNYEVRGGPSVRNNELER